MINWVPSTGVPGMVIIPARNEELTVGNVVRDVRGRSNWSVFVVDDASVDNTAKKAAENGANILKIPFRVGAWGAIQAGMEYARACGYRLCVTMDADGQHSADFLHAVSEPVTSGIADVAIGVCPERASAARQVAWALFRRMTGLELQDVTSGLRAYNEKAMRVLTTREAAMLDYQDIGVLLMLRSAGLQAAEIKVDMKSRENGHSRVYESWSTVLSYLLQTFILSAGKWHPSWHFRDVFVAKAGGFHKT